MSNYVFDFPSMLENKDIPTFTLDELRAVKTLGNSQGRVLIVFEYSVVTGRQFVCLVNGSRIGEAMASICNGNELHKIPTKYDCHTYMNLHNRTKFELYSSNNLNLPSATMVRLFIGDTKDVDVEASTWRFSKETDALDFYQENKNRGPQAYMQIHTLEGSQLTSSCRYVPLHGMPEMIN
jgi:hypothetical protein